jgi:hypothetical protein
MWEPRRLTTLWASAACYRDSCTFTLTAAPLFLWGSSLTGGRVCPMSAVHIGVPLDSAETPTNLSEEFHGFPQCLQANSREVPELEHTTG